MDVSTIRPPVSADERNRRNRHRGAVILLTGPSGAGKSTLAGAAERVLFERGLQVSVLDGDLLRAGISRDLGFTPADRAEQIRRAGSIAILMGHAGLAVFIALIAPFKADRDALRAAVGAATLPFLEVYIDTPLPVCESRDPKGLYARARAGSLGMFTGVSSPYEPPENAELRINTAELPLDENVDTLVRAVLGCVNLNG
jgi:adenylyl-sulfate kinase